jgi:hypothetical protein
VCVLAHKARQVVQLVHFAAQSLSTLKPKP